jgi:hypothetical protein
MKKKMLQETNDLLDRFMNVLSSQKDFNRVEFVILYGSVAEGRALKKSDIDLCIYYAGNRKQQSDFRERLLRLLPSRFDIQIFQEIPLYVRKNVLRGKEVYAKDSRFMYDTLTDTIKDYESFRPKLMQYVGG